MCDPTSIHKFLEFGRGVIRRVIGYQYVAETKLSKHVFEFFNRGARRWCFAKNMYLSPFREGVDGNHEVVVVDGPGKIRMNALPNF